MKNRVIAAVALATVLLAAPTLAADKHAVGSVFQDCKECPKMVVLPAGTFTMGTQDEEVGRQPDEGPLHPVTFAKPFAISHFQVSAGEWDAYVKQAKVTIANGDERPGRECVASKPRYPQGPTQPAVCMSYDDVKGYVAWLSKKTGKHYRMLSEAEREYAARAGTPGPFPFPFDEGADYSIAKHANTYGPGDGFSYTSPGGSYPPNDFGVYDMHGNVYEWVADCMHDSYNGAPSDGSAWMEASCEYHMIRGNDWTEAPIFSRSGNRNYREPYVRGDWLGFRVARDL